MHAGELPSTFDAEAFAAHTTAVSQGMSTLARNGANRKKSSRLVDAAMLVWPDLSLQEVQENSKTQTTEVGEQRCSVTNR